MKSANWPGRLSIGTLIAVGAAGSLVTLSTVAPAGATTGPDSGKVAVSQGITAASLQGSRIASAPAATRESISFVLKMQHPGALKVNVQNGMPHGYLSVRTFATRYGQPRANIAALERYLGSFGIKSTAYADGLVVTTTGTAAEYGKALSVRQSLYRLRAVAAHGTQAGRPAMVVHGTADKPLLPARLASFVSAILGLTSYPVAASDAVHTLLPEQKAPHAVQFGNRTPAAFARQYGLTALYKKGFHGQGETLGIITYASLRPSDATHFWDSVLKIRTKPNRITLDNVDGGSGPVNAAAGSGESTLDVEQSGALAPQANIVVYQAPNTDYGSADAWFLAASQNAAATVSTSWGESEVLNEAIGANGQEAATYGAIFDEAGLEMAAQGQTAFDAAGDSGAYDDAPDSTPYTELSIDNPANSPWITSVGGTTEAGTIPIAPAVSITIPAQRAWGWDYLWPYYATLSSVSPSDGTEAAMATDPAWTSGTGGGYSAVETRPGYQSAIPGLGDYTAVPYLTPADYVRFGTTTACTPPVTTGLPCVPTTWTAWAGVATNLPGSLTPPTSIQRTSAGRAVPDMAADADPDTGYELYYSQQSPRLQAGWGGTSFVAPQLNGAAAVIDSFLHHRSGFWNPAMYRFAVHSYTPFRPLDTSGASNDNLYYSGTPGAVYNPGTGLGTPNLGQLALDFKRHG